MIQYDLNSIRRYLVDQYIGHIDNIKDALYERKMEDTDNLSKEEWEKYSDLVSEEIDNMDYDDAQDLLYESKYDEYHEMSEGELLDECIWYEIDTTQFQI